MVIETWKFEHGMTADVAPTDRVTVRTWTVHHAMWRDECVRCGWREEYKTWPLGTIDRDVMDRMRDECTTVIEEVR